jgi:hypothetical protein
MQFQIKYIDFKYDLVSNVEVKSITTNFLGTLKYKYSQPFYTCAVHICKPTNHGLKTLKTFHPTENTEIFFLSSFPKQYSTITRYVILTIY